jgi:hypothetical protein
MSDPKEAGGVQHDGVPMGTSGSAASGTEAAGGTRERPPLPEADDERKERAERASRETADLGPHDDKQTSGMLESPGEAGAGGLGAGAGGAVDDPSPGGVGARTGNPNEGTDQAKS